METDVRAKSGQANPTPPQKKPTPFRQSLRSGGGEGVVRVAVP